MGDDGEMISANLNNKPSLEEGTEEQTMEEKKLNDEEEINNAEQFEFVPKSDDSNASSLALKEAEGLALGDKLEEIEEVEEETVKADGIVEAGNMHGAVPDELEAKIGAEMAVVVGGGEELALESEGGPEVESKVEVLEEKVGGEKSADLNSGDKPVMDTEVRHVEVLAEEAPFPEVELEEAVSGGGKTVFGVGDHELSSARSVVAAQEVVETVESQAEATVGDGGEKNVSNIGISELVSDDLVAVGRNDDLVVDEAGTMVEEENSITGSANLQSVANESAIAEGEKFGNESDNLQSFGNESVTFEVEQCVTDLVNLQSTAKESVTVEEDAKLVVMPVEYSVEVMRAEKLEESAEGKVATGVEKVEEMAEGKEAKGVEIVEESAEGKKAFREEILTAEIKVDIETSIEVTKVTEEEAVTGLQGNESPNVTKEEKDEVRQITEEEGLLADVEMDDIEGIEAFKNSASDDLQFGGQELVVVVNNEENKEAFPEKGIPTAIPTADTEMKEGKEAKVEIIESGDVEYTTVTDDSQVVLQDEEDEEMVAEEDVVLADTEMEPETDAGESSKAVGEKRKRRKNTQILANSKIVARAQKIMEEDVCFICFDGGDLVLCDRRGCPKAYHPSCVNRDEAFFRTKGRWNCGWHICSNCKKNAYYMCYTCTFSLCKGCVKDAVILCVRGNRGFCETCMRMVTLIENSTGGDNDQVRIDFDDKSSWEFLFKDYYTDLKSKLSLSSIEIAKGKNPWKGSDVSTSKEESPEEPVGIERGGDSGSENSAAENPKATKPRRKKFRKRLRSDAKERNSAGASVRVGAEGTSTTGNMEWASKELLEFVMHMKNGDKSVLSQFDVQALLLEYIKRNKLRDPRRKSQIICDSRLENLFGKPRVGHFEMLKLLESHFLIKEDALTNNAQGNVVDTEVNQLEADENADTPTIGIKERKRKIRKKGDSREPLSNRYDYAAIDTHNISLIYLRRKLMEDLLEDIDEFQSRVIGTFVRIRISGNTQKQDLYRLVQVVGTSNAAEPYKVGKRTTDVMLEILNLNKTEVVSMDTISNQDFTEEECKRLRQSIKCGLLNRMTVGDILDKAMEVQTARVNDWLESEILRLSHLRDRASDMGHRKELRECVEKLQILKTPEQRLRRLEEIPQIHPDPNMDPDHESDDDDRDTDDNRREGFLRTSSSGFTRRGRAPISPASDFSPKDSSSKNWESNRNSFSKNSSISGEDAIQSGDLVNENSWNQEREKDTQETGNIENLNSSIKSENVGMNSISVARSESLPGIASANPSVSQPAKEAETVMKINETQKTWHYRDPSGKVQGPFSMVQLRKWRNTGYFPTDLRIWRTVGKQDESILLTDALAGKFQISAAVTLDVAHGLSGHSRKSSETSLQLSREDSIGGRSKIDQNNGARTLQNHLGLSRGSLAPTVEVPKLSTEKWARNDLSNLPSPTPKQGNAGETGVEAGILIGGTSYPGGSQSPAAALPPHESLSSLHASVLNSWEQLHKGPENVSLISGSSFGQVPNSEQNVIGSANYLQVPSSTATREPHSLEEHGNMPAAQDNAVHRVQSVNNQNAQIATRGGFGPPTQKVESNPFSPVPGQSHAHNHWGGNIPLAQNPSGNFPNSTAPVLPQPEFWGPPAQSNQSTMQPPAVPNLAWGTGPVENHSSAPAMRAENSNTGWEAMQANPTMAWVGPAPGTTNVNWGATVRGPAAGNANSGWVMATGNLGASMQGQMPGNVNPGWVAALGNSGVQGLALSSANPGWIAPSGDVGSAVQVPVPANGWALPTGNQGAPVQGAPSGNTNQGWTAAPGNQGTWGSEQYHSGGNFSGQRDQGSQVVDSGFRGAERKGSRGDSGYGSGRPWNRQSSFGSRGGADLRNVRRDVICPFYSRGRCIKGDRCNHIHS